MLEKKNQSNRDETCEQKTKNGWDYQDGWFSDLIILRAERLLLTIRIKCDLPFNMLIMVSSMNPPISLCQKNADKKHSTCLQLLEYAFGLFPLLHSPTKICFH